VARIGISSGNKRATHKAPVEMQMIGRWAKVYLENEVFDFKEHSSLHFPANKTHSIEAISDFKMLLIK